MSISRRLLLVHAHPDDELLATGVTLAQRAAEGVDVHVLTCTLGDEGEIIPPSLAHLAADRDDTLGAYRREELARALARVGVTGHVLGESELGRGRATYRDSGMAGTPSMDHPRALCGAPLAQVASAVGAVIADLAPDVVVTYDARGGYDHPDHIRVHQATCAAVAALPAHSRPSLYAVVVRRSDAVADRAWVATHAPADQGLDLTPAEASYPPGVVDDAMVTCDVEGSAQALATRDAALAEHATQVRVGQGWYALSNNVAARLARRDSFVLLDPESGRPVAAPPQATRADGTDGVNNPHGTDGTDGTAGARP